MLALTHSHSNMFGLDQALTDDVSNELYKLKEFAEDARSADKMATLVGIGGGVVGLIAGAFVGRWAGGHRPLVTLGGATGGGLALGFGSFFVSRRLMAPTPPIPGAPS